MPATNVGFYCELPRPVINEIRRRARRMSLPQWKIIEKAIMRPAKGEVRVHVKTPSIDLTEARRALASRYASSPNFTAQHAALQSKTKKTKHHGRK